MLGAEQKTESHLLASPSAPPPGSHQAHGQPHGGASGAQHLRVKGPSGLHVCSSLLPPGWWKASSSQAACAGRSGW